MPAQFDSTATYRPDLEGAVRTFAMADQARRMFIAHLALPYQNEAEKTGQFPALAKENFRKLVDTNRGADGSFNRGDFGWSMLNYATVESAWEEPTDNSDTARFRNVLDLEKEAAIGADYVIRLAHEKRVADAVMNATTFTATNVATSWATIATSTPLADIDIAANKLEDQLGIPRQAFTLILPRLRWQNLRQAATVLDVMKSWGSGISRAEDIKLNTIRDYLDVKEILIGSGAYDSTNEGIAQSFSQIWPVQYGMLALLAPGESAPRKTLCLGRSVKWTWPGPADVSIQTYDDTARDARIARARHFTQAFIQSSFAGELLDLTAAS